MRKHTQIEAVGDVGPPNAREARGTVPRRVWSGTALQVLGRMWGSACTVLILWLLARHLDGAAFGRFTFYLAVFMVLDSLADFGTGQVAIQRTAADPSAVSAVLAAARRIRLRAASLGLIVVGSAVFVFGEPGAGWIALAAAYPLTHTLELSATVFKNRIDWRIPVSMRALSSTLTLLIVLAMIARGVREPGLYILAAAIGSALGNVALHLAARRHLPPPCADARRYTRGILATALPLGVAGLCQHSYFYVDNLFVRAIEGDQALGWYNIGVRVLSYAIMVGLYASAAALPWFARAHERGQLGEAVQSLAQPLFLAASLCAGLLMPWTERLLALFGSEFTAGGDSLRWLLVAVTMIYAGAPFLTALVATGRTRAVLVIAASALGVNLIGNTWLVPQNGIEGAAQATLATELVVAVGAAIALWRGGVRPRPSARVALWLAGPLLIAASAWASSNVFG